jgi:hypothetical protein
VIPRTRGAHPYRVRRLISTRIFRGRAERIPTERAASVSYLEYPLEPCVDIFGMQTHTLIAFALTALLLAACEQKSGVQTLPSATSTPSPTFSPAATPQSTPSPAAPTPLKSPDVTTPSPIPSPSAASSDGRPTFSSESANEYVQSYDAYINDFKMAYQAMKQGDMMKYQAVIQRAHELENKGEKLGGELSQEEQARFADYLNRKADELAQFASQNR